MLPLKGAPATMPSLSQITGAIVGGIALGWFSVPHCFAMCGPLHLGIGTAGDKRPLPTLLLLNAGRSLGYSLLGAVAGGVGWAVAGVPCHLPGGGPAVKFARLFPAAVMLLMSYKAFRRSAAFASVPPVVKRLFASRRCGAVFAAGCAASLLPCGLLYAALGAAAGAASPVLGAAMMFSYCLVVSFFLMLGVMVGTLTLRRPAKWAAACFPWLALAGGLAYLVLAFV